MTELMYDMLMEHLDDLADMGYPICAIEKTRKMIKENEEVAIICYNYYFGGFGH